MNDPPSDYRQQVFHHRGSIRRHFSARLVLLFLKIFPSAQSTDEIYSWSNIQDFTFATDSFCTCVKSEGNWDIRACRLTSRRSNVTVLCDWHTCMRVLERVSERWYRSVDGWCKLSASVYSLVMIFSFPLSVRSSKSRLQTVQTAQKVNKYMNTKMSHSA